MTESQDRLTSLNSAAALCVLRRTLKNAGVASIFVGIVWLIPVIVLIHAHRPTPLSVLFLVVAASLLAEGIYVVRRCSRTALLLEAITLSAFAVLDLADFVLVVHSSSLGHHTGRVPNPAVGIVAAFGAMRMWKHYRNFDHLYEQTNDLDIEHVSAQIKAALAAEPASALNLVPLKRIGLTLKSLQWRLWVDDDYAYLIGAERMLFRPNRPSEISVLLRSRLSFEMLGESWIGSARKLRFVNDGVPMPSTFELAPGMTERLASLTGGVLSAG